MANISSVAKIIMSKDEMDLVFFLLQKTGSLARDCVINKTDTGDKLIFVVNKDDIPKIIGRSGEMINTLKKELKKDIDVVVYADKLEQFVCNLFHPIKLNNVNLKTTKEKKHIIEIYVDKKDIGRAIGKQGIFLERAKLVLNRHFSGIANLKIIGGMKSHKVQ
jgi:N utilization substance protein A